MPRKTGRLSSIMGQSAAQISGASLSEAKSQYNYLRKVIREREKSFAKAGKQGTFDRQYGIMGPPSLRGLSEAQVKKQIIRMVKQLSGPSATVTGMKIQKMMADRHRKQGLEKVLNAGKGRQLSDAEWDKYGRFLGDMQERYGDNWKRVSDDYIEMLDDPAFQDILGISEDLGLHASQFMKNYEYWKAHADDLKKAVPIRSRGKRKRALTPSDYIRQLGLPSIKDWNKEHKDDNTGEWL